MRFSFFSRRLSPELALLLAFGLFCWTGCDDGSLTAPEIRGPADTPLFGSYVALGNSITAGFQSGGLDSTSQSQSYAVLLAEQMNTPFGVPEFNSPGCPPRLSQFFNAQGVPEPMRPNNATESTCGFRDPQVPLQLNNVAVPRARVVDVLSNTKPGSTPNPLTQFILGGRTQAEAALEANPTFATVWIGNNDVLAPALNGTANATPLGTFASNYTQLLDELTSSPQFRGGVLLGVSNVTFLPFFSPGPAYAGLKQAGQFPPNFEVAGNCDTQDPSTGLTPLVPLDYGFGLIGRAMQTPNQTVTLDCQTPDEVLTLTEVASLSRRVQQYNQFIQQQAQQRDLAYLDPNPIFSSLYRNDDGDANPTNDLIPKFPDTDGDQPFGPFFSLDGLHPSAQTHRLVTDQLVQTISREYGVELPSPDNVPQLPSAGS